MLTVENLSYQRHKQTLLHQLNFQLHPNEIICLTGGNGVGKTTLLDILTGALPASSGKIHNPLPQQKAHWLGYLPDKPPLYPQLRVDEYLWLCAEMRGLSPAREAVQSVLESCDLCAVQHQKCSDLSHGYRQRVGLAQAIIHQPLLLILDEPCNGLDRAQRQKLTPLLRAQTAHSTILMTSHDFEEIIAVADRVFFLHNKALWEIPLPTRTDIHHWIACPTQAEANLFYQQYQNIINICDGRYFGFHTLPKALWNTLEHRPDLIHYPHYPAQALQEKLHDVESLIP